MKYVANLSGGKDSLAMCLGLIEKGLPLDVAVFYDTGMEFKAVYKVIEQIRPMLENYGAKLVILKPNTDFLLDMLIRPVCKGECNEHYGYEWCGGCTRWRTSHKVTQINAYLKTLGDYIQYVGIAADEPERIKNENNKKYPLVEWEWTEAICLQYCYDKGFNWKETLSDGSISPDLYQLLDRVSCWCCSNKNLKELKNIYYFLPDYWGLLKGLQSRIDRPFRRDGKSIFDLEERFKSEGYQLSLFAV